MPHKSLLDPQGKAVGSGMKSLNLNAIDNVRIGKHITFEIEAADEAKAREQAETACQKLLANPIMEFYEIEISAE